MWLIEQERDCVRFFFGACVSVSTPSNCCLTKGNKSFFLFYPTKSKYALNKPICQTSLHKFKNVDWNLFKFYVCPFGEKKKFLWVLNCEFEPPQAFKQINCLKHRDSCIGWELPAPIWSMNNARKSVSIELGRQMWMQTLFLLVCVCFLSRLYFQIRINYAEINKSIAIGRHLFHSSGLYSK